MKIFKQLFYAFICAALALTALGVQPARAAGIVVNSAADTIANDGACTLREAITNTNNDTNTWPDCAAGFGADVIIFAADYTITLGSQLPVITSWVLIMGHGAANTIIQANALPNTATYRVLEISAAGNLILDGVTVRNGKTSSSGGGIYNQGTATISASTLSGNTADYGGGIYSSGTATISASTLSGNTADSGGGIFSWGTATISASTLSGNTADSGGGILNYASLSVANSTLAGNSATGSGGGAIHNGNFGITTLTNVTISGSSSASQAAVWNQSGR